jgi:hypothetical protein
MYILYQKETPVLCVQGFLLCRKVLFEHFVLAVSYFSHKSIIASGELNFCVRNENRCNISDKPPEQSVQITKQKIYNVHVLTCFSNLLIGGDVDVLVLLG